MLRNWLKIAFINYRRNWLSTLINVLGLSGGLCIFLLIFINYNDEKSYEQWIPNKENLYYVENYHPAFGPMNVSSFPELAASKEKYGEIEDFTIASFWPDFNQKLMFGEQSVYTNKCLVAANFFEFFPFEKLAGNYKNALTDHSKIAISEDTAIALFGENFNNSIGKMVKVDSEEQKSYVVTAVYRLPKSNTVYKPGFIILHPDVGRKDLHWGNFSYFGFFKLKPGTNLLLLQDKLSKDLDREQRKISEKWGDIYDEKNPMKVVLTPIAKMKLDAISEGIGKGDKKSLMILMSLSCLILLLSGINFTNLKIAQAAQRAKEVGVRKAIGGTKLQIVLQFLIENFLVCGFSLLIALSLIELLLPFYNQFLNKEIRIDEGTVLLYSGGILLGFALLSGLIPAFYLSNFKPINTLKGNFSRSRQGVWLRNSILMIQLIISSFFMICSLIINAQIKYMKSRDLGFYGEQVINVNYKKTDWKNDYNYKKYLRIKNEIANIAGVTDVTASVFRIGDGLMNTSNVKIAADTTKNLNNVGVGGIDYNFFKFYKIKFLAGRDLDLRFASDTISGAIANETFVRKMGLTPSQALGKEIHPGWETKKNYKIIGVVKDFYVNGVDQAIEPLVLFNYDRTWVKNNINTVQVKIASHDIQGTLERIQDYWTTKVEPGYPYDYEFVDKKFEKTFDKFRKQQALFNVLNIVVLSVALLGLFALSSLLIEQKLKDVAIKKTLGANEKQIVWDLSKKFLYISTIAILISFPLAYYAMNEWLKDFHYRINMPVLPYLISLGALLLLTFLIVSIKAFCATKVEMVKYLKYE